jgi:hypothetical protein
MMIFLGSSPNNPFALLDIVDCTSEMAKGGEKDAKYMGKLFIYLALAKPALPGQFDLLVSSQRKENAAKYFCLFRWAARNKSGDFWAAQKYFNISEQHKFLLFVFFIAQNWMTMGSKNLIPVQHKMLDFLKG